MIFIILYMLSIPIILYYNFFAMRRVSEKSGLARLPFFFLIYSAITYGSIIGLWSNNGWQIALLAFVVSWTINKASFRLFFRQYVQQTTQSLMTYDWFEPELPKDERLRKAYEFAEATALNNVAGKQS